MAIYMKINGMNGNVSVKNYENWIALENLEFSGVSTSVKRQVGTTQNRVAGEPRFGDINVIKVADPSSVKLFENAHSGTVIPQAEIHFTSTGNPPFAYSKYILKNVLVSHYSEEHDAQSGKPKEYLTLNYETIQKTYIPRDEKNNAGSPMISGYDTAQAEKM